MTFDWPQGGSFSFDLGGHLRYGDFAGQQFYAEVKNYAAVSNLGAHYSDFLAKCYVTYQALPSYADHFMWVSWTPHRITKWASLTSAEEVRLAVIAHAERIFPADADPEAAVDGDLCTRVSERLWILILSQKQEQLVPSVEHLALIQAREMEKAAAT